MRYLICLLMALPAIASCPGSIKCDYHNVYYVPKTGTEYRNGKQFGVYEHTYYEGGRRRQCVLLVRCD